MEDNRTQRATQVYASAATQPPAGPHGGVNIAASIARARKSRSMTQEDVARCLGVTKAAVSKWELGQSLPDVAQLPRIASLFEMTLDELFDYRPQLSPDEVNAAVAEVNALLSQNCDAGIARCCELARDYASCAELLSALGIVIVGAVPVCPERAEEMLDLAERLLDRSESLIGGIGGADLQPVCEMPLRKHAVVARVSLLVMQGNDEEATALLERELDNSPDIARPLLSSLYEKAGRTEDARRVLQEMLYRSSIETRQAAEGLARLYPDDAGRALSYLEGAERVEEAFGLGAEPLKRLSRCGAKARALLMEKKEARAVEEIAEYVASLERVAAELGRGGLPPAKLPALFDLVKGKQSGSDPLSGVVLGTALVALADGVLEDPAWQAVEDGRMPALRKRLKAVRDGATAAS